MSEDTKKRPTHIVWQVIESGVEGQKDYFNRIGVAWANKKGMNVVLEAVPLRGRIAILERRDDNEAQSEPQTPGDSQ